MMNAYDEIYLDDAMKNLGEAFDFAIHVCQKDADEFMDLFVLSEYASYFEKGNPKIVAGKSGTELVLDILEKVYNRSFSFSSQVEYEYSQEYWLGWVLAYYQWKTGRPFKEIHEMVKMEEILKLYPTLHEASEEKFVDTMNSILRSRTQTTKLQKQRKRRGYSQRELAIQSQVNLRTLQQYELGTKELRKASVVTVLSLANALGCQIEDLIEYEL